MISIEHWRRGANPDSPRADKPRRPRKGALANAGQSLFAAAAMAVSMAAGAQDDTEARNPNHSIERSLSRIEATLAEHGAILRSHGAILRSHGERLQNIEADIAELKVGVAELTGEARVTSQQRTSMDRRIGSLETTQGAWSIGLLGAFIAAMVSLIALVGWDLHLRRRVPPPAWGASPAPATSGRRYAPLAPRSAGGRPRANLFRPARGA